MQSRILPLLRPLDQSRKRLAQGGGGFHDVTSMVVTECAQNQARIQIVPVLAGALSSLNGPLKFEMVINQLRS